MGKGRKGKGNVRRVREFVEAAAYLESVISKIEAEAEKRPEILIIDLEEMLSFYKENIFRLVSGGAELGNFYRERKKESRKAVSDAI